MRRARRSFAGHTFSAGLDDANGTNSTENSGQSPVVRNVSDERNCNDGVSGLGGAIDARNANATITADSRGKIIEGDEEDGEEDSPVGGVAVDIA